MTSSSVIKMPKRFDYGANAEFNGAFSAALAQGGKNIQLDCAGMEYIDSAGIGLLVMAHKKAQSHHSKISLISVTLYVKEVLSLANLQKLIEIK